MTTPRLRFAPAPTGYLHVGSARTALFNWLYARQTGGELILRIEDTNAELNKPGLVEHIIDSLDWLGITFDGEPVLQSERGELYDGAIDGWVEAGLAYHSDGAIFFTVPDDGTTVVDDIIRGRVEFANANLSDFVIRRSDGTATFVVANAVDDLDLGITHIIRGEDMLNITPQALLLRQALGATTPPVYAHLPLIVDEQRKKLSKRRNDVAVGDFRSQGILPEALVNHLALLGWGPPDNIEVRPIAEIADLFRLENVNTAPAVFDTAKLEAINATYIRALSPAQFATAIEPWVERTDWGASGGLHQRLTKLVPLIAPRTKLLADAPAQLDFFFTDELEIDGDVWAKLTEGGQAFCDILARTIEICDSFDWLADPHSASPEQLANKIRAVADAAGLKLRVAQAPIRVAVTGRTVGPPLFESMLLLGRDTTLARLRSTHERLSGHSSDHSTDHNPATPATTPPATPAITPPIT